jgi:Cu(I)/Ag(I) efflux system membrane fusion protein
MVQTLGMRTAVVERGSGTVEIRAVGVVGLDEHRIVAIEARAAGWVEALKVRAVGDPVRRGQAVAGVYAPDLYAAQQELALAAHGGDEALLSASKQRLALLSVPASQVDAIARGGQPSRQVAIVSPADGVVTELNVREGAQVSPGMPLMRVADLSRIWVEVQVPERQGAQLQVGDTVQIVAAALPGKPLSGALDYVYPDLDTATRTLRARVALDNPGFALRPGMYVDVGLGATPVSGSDTLTVPTEAVIRTGTRTMVIVADGNGRFHPASVTLGAEQGDRTAILTGLEAGQQVVTSGQFLIDSEASLRGAYKRMATP